AKRLVRLGYAAATGAGIGSLLFWVIYWFSFVRGNLQGPDFFNFYAAAKLYVSNGGAAVYDIAMQRQVELQITGHDPSSFVVLLIPILFLARRAWRALAAFAGVLAGLGLISVAGFGIGPVTTYLTTVGTWAATGRLPSTGQLVYTDPAVYSLRNILEVLPGGG